MVNAHGGEAPAAGADAAPRRSRARGWLRAALLVFALLLVLAVVALATLLGYEMHTSRWQAGYLARISREASFAPGRGPSDAIRFPDPGGPYDLRLGYAQLPAFTQRLQQRGFAVTEQARDSRMFLALAARGLHPPYPEKDQAGLTLLDTTGATLYRAVSPQNVYAGFAAVPPVLAATLAFIEDRHLLEEDAPRRNPAVNWGRFTLAAVDQVVRLVNPGHAAPGGSTLATQIDKFRHSPGGRTSSGAEKLRQMASASLAAYAGGEDTVQARRAILVRYLNTEPLGAHAGEGEISGLGDGLAAWYGRDFGEVNRLLAAIPHAGAGHPPDHGDALEQEALAFKQALSLLIAQRAPSYYLARHNDELARLTDTYLRLLAGNAVIPSQLRDAALPQPLHLRHDARPAAEATFAERKGVSLLRNELVGLLGVPGTYEIDRLDLRAQATLQAAVQDQVARVLAEVQTRAGARKAGLVGYGMLRPQDDPSHIAYSFTLYERASGANLLRVNTDSVNEPFDLNQGARLNLGSTAKVRTLVLYLQIMADLHARYAAQPAEALAAARADPFDALTAWALDYLRTAPDRSLGAMLQAAVGRKYPANPGEVFVTGGGHQRFSNFLAREDSQAFSVAEGLRYSVNLVYVRLMRDVVHYEMVRQAGPSTQWLTDPAIREKVLRRFADRESRVYLHRFYEQYHAATPEQALRKLLAKVPRVPLRIAAALRSVDPAAPPDWFGQELRQALQGTRHAPLGEDEVLQLYDKYGPDRFDLDDRAYLARVHPLELWVVAALRRDPQAAEGELQEASRDARIASYAWLFKPRMRAVQDRRILATIEREAYRPIARAWRALGYPFQSITPSYGSALGASGDRPAALAELMGVLVAGGVVQPAQDLVRLTFARDTPYETRFAARPPAGRRVLPPELVQVVRSALADVVAQGTGSRLAAGLPLGDGTTLPVAGKTGTGDQRLNVYRRGGGLLESRRVNRSANFIYILGDRFYGTVTAYAHEPHAARYAFTSAMAVQLLRSLGPTLAPLLRARP